MERKRVGSFKKYLEIVEELTDGKHEIILFRGQSDESPLLPSIARQNPVEDTTAKEMEMLAELKRMSQLTMKINLSSDWEWLVYAQHFGMKTRLLDWSSNPLTALWFACSNEYRLKEDSFVYIFSADNTFLINTGGNENPFQTSKTRILKPALNNERIIAQAGWFTAHKYAPKLNEFVNLESNKDVTKRLTQLRIPATIKKQSLKSLSIFGINAQSLFPDITGICQHLNWMYTG